MRFVDKDVNAKQLSPLNLAFIGDCIYEILVRETLVLDANRPVNDLHKESVKYVSAKAQTVAFEKIKNLSAAVCRISTPCHLIPPQLHLFPLYQLRFGKSQGSQP